MPASIDSAADDPPARVRVLVAARDEAQRIGATIAALRRALPGAAIFLADDCSRDRTAEIARGLGARVIGSGRHLGKGAAMSAAAACALTPARAGTHAGAGAEEQAIFLLCDGDLGESAQELAALVRAVGAGEADLAVGVFAHPAGGGLGIVRTFARLALWRACGRRMRAPLSGQRALTAAALAQLLPFCAGYGMELGMTIDAARAGLRLVELELELSHRATGRTPAGFAHRAAQLLDLARAYRARGARA